ncbi:MAG: phosphate acyltransferase, partial [Pseudomonadota bacterium]
MASGVADRPIDDFKAYCEELDRFVFRSGLVMKPVFDRARADPKRVIYAEGEDERILRATQVAVEEGIAKPTLIGRPEVIENRLERFGLTVRPGKDFDIVNPDSDPRYREYVDLYLKLMGRRGVTPERARTVVRTRSSVIAALSLYRGEADAMICGLEGRFDRHLAHINSILGCKPGVTEHSALSLVILPQGVYFLTDTHVTHDPTPEQIAETTMMAADAVERFGITPKVALLSHSNFGSGDTESARKMREAYKQLRRRMPELEVDGEMHADVALDEQLRQRIFPHSRLTGSANVLVMPNLDAASIAFEMLRALGNGLPIGPMLIGPAKPAHILTPSVTSRGIVNLTAIAVVEAQQSRGIVLQELD